MSAEDWLPGFGWDEDDWDPQPGRCKYCGRLIEWEQREGRWAPVTPSGKPHHCKEYEEHRREEISEEFEDFPE